LIDVECARMRKGEKEGSGRGGETFLLGGTEWNKNATQPGENFLGDGRGKESHDPFRRRPLPSRRKKENGKKGKKKRIQQTLTQKSLVDPCKKKEGGGERAEEKILEGVQK